MAGSQSAFDVEQYMAQLVAEHAAQCAKLACAAKDESFNLALDLILWPLALVVVAIVLHRAGFWNGLHNALGKRLKRTWLADAVFGAVVAMVFVAVSLPFGLIDALTVDPATQSSFRCAPRVKNCPIPEPTRGGIVRSLFESEFKRAVLLAAIFAVLAPLGLYLQRRRPRLLAVLAAGAYLVWLTNPTDTLWKQTYPFPSGALREDVATIAVRAGIGMDRVVIGQPWQPGQDGGGGQVTWSGMTTQAVMSERMLNIYMLHPRAFSPSFGPYSAREFRWVAAHEIAHLRHGHFEWTIAAYVILASALTLAALLGARRLIHRDMAQGGAARLVMFMALGFALHFAALPVRQNLSRFFENQADATGLDLARDSQGAIVFTMQDARKEPLVRDHWYHRLYRSHPDSMTRLRRMVEWQAAHQPDQWRAQGLTGPVRTRWRDELELVTDWPEKDLSEMPRTESVGQER